MLIRKIIRHCEPNRSAWTSAPPTIGPQTDASPAAAPYAPRALPRSSALKLTWMVETSWGTIAAAASPCTTRAAISSSMVGAKPQAVEARVKPPIPIRNIFLRPTMSPSRPPVMRATAKVSV